MNYDHLLGHIDILRNSKVIGIDTETTGLDPLQNRIRLIQIATPNYPVIIFDMWKIDEPTIGFLREMMNSDAIKVFQNAKFDIKFLRQENLPVAGKIFDTYIAGQLLRQKNGLARFGLDSLVDHYLSIHLSKEQQRSNWNGSLTMEQYKYSAKDAAVLIPLRKVMFRDLQLENLINVAKIEFGCLFAVAEMELAGIRLDLGKWRELGEQLERQKEMYSDLLKEELRKPVVQLSLFEDDEPTNPNFDSPKQMLQALKNMGIPIKKTSRSHLLPLSSQFPVIEHLIGYRKATKVLQSFIYTIPKAVHPVTGRVHPRYHQMGTLTGRFSCSHPNLQQIPRDPRFRRCFVPKPGYNLVIADYSQIELRVVAEISEDQTMIEAYRTGQDLHRLTAAIISNKEMDKVTKKDRQAAKAINFGLIYAMGANRLHRYAETTYGVAMTLEEAELFRNRFFQAYTGVERWHKTVMKSKPTVSETLGGRKQRWSGNIGASGLYNWPVQGTAADIVKQAMADLYLNLKGSRAKIIGMVHDELILEAPHDEAGRTAEILKGTMEQAGSKYLSNIPVIAETSIAENWAGK